MPARPLPALLELPVGQAIWSLAWPTIVLGLMRSLYFLTDTFWVGGLGTEALAALAGCTFATWIGTSLTEISSIGLYSEVARATGAGELTRARRAAGHGLLLALGMGALTGLLMWGLAGTYLELLGVRTPLVRSLGLEFLAITALGSIPQALFGALTSTFRAQGNARAPMWIFGGTLLVNAVLDPLFIFGIGPFEGWGIGGAAFATLLAQVLGMWWSWRLLIRSGHGPMLGRLELTWMSRMGAIGLPIGTSGIGFSMVYVLLGRVINLFGPAALAAVGLGHNLEKLGYLTCIGFEVAATTLVGQWIGAGNPERAEAMAHAVARQMTRVLLPITVVCVIFAPWLVMPFSTDPVVILEASRYLRFNGVVMILMGYELVYQGAFAGVGRTLPPLLISFPMSLARVPLSYVVAVTWGFGVTGVWATIAVTTIGRGLLMRAWFSRGGWKKSTLGGTELRI